MKNGTPWMESGRVGLCPTICIVILLSVQAVCPQMIRNTTYSGEVGTPMASPAIQVKNDGQGQVIVDNGIVRVTFSCPQGLVTGIKFQGIDNVLDPNVGDSGYWDVYWSAAWRGSTIDKMKGTEFKIVTHTEDQVELSFSRTWNSSSPGYLAPLNVDKRYIIRKGSSGLYIYAILERLKGWPDVRMDQIRIVFKLHREKFRFMAISDDRQRLMPTAADRDTGNGRAEFLDYKEAVRLIKPENPAFTGEVDDKYQYAMEDQDIKVHGWISSDPRVGFWMISPSDEYRCGGPVKQDLTSHVGPTNLAMFISTHYAGLAMDTAYKSAEPWKKVFGPVFVHLNSVPPNVNQLQLWKGAKNQMLKEVASWPYDFVASDDFPKAHQRGTVKGQLLVIDSYISCSTIPGKNAYVGLSPPGPVGSWQTQTKGYQFWTRADDKGKFIINHVRPGTYSLFAWVPGFIGDYKYEDINITSAGVSDLGPLVYTPPRKGPTLWEIGIPDRTAEEFFIPDPYPDLENRLFVNNQKEKFRQYGLWRRYTDIYPKDDLVYTVGSSDYRKDWFYAHVPRKLGNNTLKATSWQIVFDERAINPNASYTLRLALASATYARLVVRVNDPNSNLVFWSVLIGRETSIARHGIHGLYAHFGIDVPGKLLKTGRNTIYLTQARATAPFIGVMYDYIRLEGPSRI